MNRSNSKFVYLIKWIFFSTSKPILIVLKDAITYSYKLNESI